MWRRRVRGPPGGALHAFPGWPAPPVLAAAMRRARLRVACVASLSLALLAAGESGLATGIRHVKEGAFEEGLLTLDEVARQLAKDPGRGGELAQAYLYLGVAYVALGQE